MQRNFGNDLTSFRRQRAFVFVSPLREEISFEDEIGKKRDNTVPVACKRKEAYVSSTGTGRCACYGSTISIRLFHSRREKEGTNVVIHLWEEDFTHRSSLSLCNKTSWLRFYRDTRDVCPPNLWAPLIRPLTDGYKKLPSSVWRFRERTQIQLRLLLLKFLLRGKYGFSMVSKDLIISEMSRPAPCFSLKFPREKIVWGRGRGRKGRKELFLSYPQLDEAGDLRVISMAVGV